jgi:hypothetical protein
MDHQVQLLESQEKGKSTKTNCAFEKTVKDSSIKIGKGERKSPILGPQTKSKAKRRTGRTEKRTS